MLCSWIVWHCLNSISLSINHYYSFHLLCQLVMKYYLFIFCFFFCVCLNVNFVVFCVGVIIDRFSVKHIHKQFIIFIITIIFIVITNSSRVITTSKKSTKICFVLIFTPIQKVSKISHELCYICIEKLGSQWANFHETTYWRFSLNSVNWIKFQLKSNTNTRHFRWIYTYMYMICLCNINKLCSLWGTR
jgi:hypothetical protein